MALSIDTNVPSTNTFASRMRARKHTVGHKKKDCCIVYTTITNRYFYPRNCCSQGHGPVSCVCVCLPKYQILIIEDLVLLTTQSIGHRKFAFTGKAAIV